MVVFLLLSTIYTVFYIRRYARVFPTLTLGFVFLNALVYYWCLATGASGTYETAIFKYSLLPGVPDPAAFFTMMFMHAGADHIIGNMMFLVVFGMAVEDDLGPFGFTGFYLITGILGSVAHYLWGTTPGQPALPGLGASGAVAGVMGGYLSLIPGQSLTSIRKHGVLFLVVSTLLALYGIKTMMGDFTAILHPNPHAMGGVAHWAHVGGFTSGFLGGLILRPLLRTHRELDTIVIYKPRKFSFQPEETEEETVSETPTQPPPVWINWPAVQKQFATGVWPPKVKELVRTQNRVELIQLLTRMRDHQASKGSTDMVKDLTQTLALLGERKTGSFSEPS